MTGKSLHGLGCEAGFNPAGDGKVSKSMPIEAIDTFKFVEQWQELSLDQVVVSDMSPVTIREDQVVHLRELRL
jgi:hypothetical protein